MDRIREEFSESPAAQTNGTNNCSGGPARTELRSFRWEVQIWGVWLGGPGGVLHFAGGTGADRAVPADLQPDQAPQFLGLPTTGTGSHAARRTHSGAGRTIIESGTTIGGRSLAASRRAASAVSMSSQYSPVGGLVLPTPPRTLRLEHDALWKAAYLWTPFHAMIDGEFHMATPLD